MAIEATETQFRSLLTGAADAIATGDYATARQKLMQARLVLAAFPISVSTEKSTITRRTDLDKLQADLDNLEATAAARSDRKRFIRSRTGYGGA